MKISSFLKLVEIRTKVASILPFTIGTLYSIYKYRVLDIENLILFFISMISLDMGTTAINNYIDHKKAIKRDGYNYQFHNAIVKDSLEKKSVLIVILLLLILAIVNGLLLFLNTDWVVLVVGIISFKIAILYSFGPIPISRTPLGEIFSGIIMGGIILFISIYIHIFNNNIILASFNNPNFSLVLNISELIPIILISIPLIVMISNIMLANNICDLEDDIQNKRYTLPYYVGLKKSLFLYTALYVLAYLVLLTAIMLKILPVISLLTIITAIPVFKNVTKFYKVQKKSETFVYSVKNFIIIGCTWIITLVIAIIYT